MGVESLDTGVDNPVELALRNQLMRVIDEFLKEEPLTYIQLDGVLGYIQTEFRAQGLGLLREPRDG